MTEDEISELIAGELNGELEADERRALQQWLDEDERHRATLERAREIHLQARTLYPAREPDVERALRAVKQARRLPRARKRVVRYAAAIALLAAGWWWLQASRGDVEENGRLFHRVAIPGHARALLRQGDGAEFALGEAPGEGERLLSSLDGVTVAASGERLLVYSDEAADAPAGEGKVDELIVPRGGEFRLSLPDGTSVTLNAASRLVFPRRFAAGERRVRLEGEAFFDVSPDASRPFIVEAEGLVVRVSGTRFNVSAYPGNAVRHATLVEGRVEVSGDGFSPVGLLPGEQLYRSGEAWEKREVDANLFISWLKGKFLFRDTELEEIARQLSRWYDVDVAFEDEGLKRIRFTGGVVRYDPLEELIRAIEATSNARFRVEGERLMIYR